MTLDTVIRSLDASILRQKASAERRNWKPEKRSPQALWHDPRQRLEGRGGRRLRAPSSSPPLFKGFANSPYQAVHEHLESHASTQRQCAAKHISAQYLAAISYARTLPPDLYNRLVTGGAGRCSTRYAVKQAWRLFHFQRLDTVPAIIGEVGKFCVLHSARPWSPAPAGWRQTSKDSRSEIRGRHRPPVSGATKAKA